MIADLESALESAPAIQSRHIGEAVQYRSLDSPIGPEAGLEVSRLE